MMNLQKIMQQAQKMQDEMKRVQEELGRTEVTGRAGGDAVAITCNGKYEFLKVSISPEAAQDQEMLEDLILAALKDATGQISKIAESKMSAVTAGMNIPGLPGF